MTWNLHLIDLHTHTTASDGTFSPAKLVHLAKDEGLQAVAITDHDTIAGNAEALTIGREIGIEVVPGVEISADSPFGSIHIVGLLIDTEDEKMESILTELREYRYKRNVKMIDLLVGMGIPITMEELVVISGGDLVGRPHFAALLVSKGVVSSYQEAFNKYLKAGGKAYLDKKRLPVNEAILMIKNSGGIPILAHPYVLRIKDEENIEANIEYLVELGIEGIEVFYSEHSRGDEALFADLARRHSLLVSGGTDFHGDVKPGVSLGRGHGNLNIPYYLLESIKEMVA
ncbi:phosphoesterase [candidate division LCP-89 bacterium B3_LCP]|uniref:Phosphoesterase n=1 Tax=candidate division LCP-89 bacterium B3_LCP TaxID=2012998 RepID=A0A532V513_UNCL8|nr:MAG: phosphoesterase [candidate division LCP-89 bacterium B3_LCP]